MAGLVQLYAVIPYVRDILKRETKPNIVSWFLWTLLQLVAIWIQVSSPTGFSWSIIFLVAMTFNTALVVVLCLMGYGYQKFGKTEKGCFIVALIAIVLFAVTKNGPVALGFDIAADFIAALPTIVKTWREPRTESFLPWFLISIAALLGVFSSTIMSFENLAFPIYLMCVNGLIAVIAFCGQRKNVLHS